MKTCTKCGEVKEQGEFYKGRGDCKKCKKSVSRARYDDNRELILEQRREYYSDNAEEIKARVAQWQRNNPEKMAQYEREKTERGRYEIKWRESPEWFALLDEYGNICLCCGTDEDLVPDHIIPLIHGGPNVIGNIQPLCGKCNQRKQSKIIDYRRVGTDT